MTREEAVELANRYLSDNRISPIRLVGVRPSDVEGLRALNRVVEEIGEDTVLTDYWIVEYLIHRSVMIAASVTEQVPESYMLGVTKGSKTVFPIVIHDGPTHKRFPLDE
jgi:hypothetical protein